MAKCSDFYHNIIFYTFPTILQNCGRSEIFQALNHHSLWPPGGLRYKDPKDPNISCQMIL